MGFGGVALPEANRFLPGCQPVDHADSRGSRWYPDRDGLTCASRVSTLDKSPGCGDTAATGVPGTAPVNAELSNSYPRISPDAVCEQRGETAVAKGKRTFQPNNRRRARVHGFRLRMRTRAGRAIVTGRRRKGRRSLTA